MSTFTSRLRWLIPLAVLAVVVLSIAGGAFATPSPEFPIKLKAANGVVTIKHRPSRMPFFRRLAQLPLAVASELLYGRIPALEKEIKQSAAADVGAAKQRSQNATRSFTSVMAWARRNASSRPSLSRWKAMRMRGRRDLETRDRRGSVTTCSKSTAERASAKRAPTPMIRARPSE